MQRPSNVAVLEIPDFSHLAVHPSILFFCVVECVKDFDVCLVLVESVPRWAVSFSSRLLRRSPAQIFMSLSSFRCVFGRRVKSA